MSSAFDLFPMLEKKNPILKWGLHFVYRRAFNDIVNPRMNDYGIQIWTAKNLETFDGSGRASQWIGKHFPAEGSI